MPNHRSPFTPFAMPRRNDPDYSTRIVEWRRQTIRNKHAAETPEQTRARRERQNARYHLRMKTDPEYAAMRRGVRQRMTDEQRRLSTEYSREYQRRNKRRLWEQEKQRQQDPAYLMRVRVRHRLLKALRGIGKHAGTLTLLGCTIPELRVHLEKQFLPEMTWDNHTYYGWHIDHIRPVASFDLTDPMQQRRCFHYTNLQPLWQHDNARKSKRYAA